MDKIIIEDLEVYAYHGVAPEEKALGQMFLVCLELGVNLEDAAREDRLGMTVSYSRVCDTVEEILGKKKYDLIEAAALAIIQGIFERYSNIGRVKVLLKKPWAPMGRHLKYAAVEMERARSEAGNGAESGTGNDAGNGPEKNERNC